MSSLFAWARQSSFVRYSGVGLGLLAGYTTYAELKEVNELEKGVVLMLDLEAKKIVEDKYGASGGFRDPITSLLKKNKNVSVGEVVDALQSAENDDRVGGLYMSLSASKSPVSKGGLAAFQELRQAVVSFTEAKKKQKTSEESVTGSDKTGNNGASEPLPVSIAWTSSFGEGSSATATYYLASGCEKVYIQPTGGLELLGLSMSSIFLKELLSKLKIKATFVAREEFKNAANMFTESDYTKAHASASKAYLQSIYQQIVGDVARSRKMRERLVSYYINRAPLNCTDSIKAGLVDGALYRDEVMSIIKKMSPDKENASEQLIPFAQKSKSDSLKTMSVQRYLKIKRKEEMRDSLMKWAKSGFQSTAAGTIVLVNLSGQIRSGTKSDDSYAQNVIWSKDVSSVLRKIRMNDSNCRAVVIRVNSPGGSAIGSDEIRREIELLSKDAHKPVIISMGSLAASGGYLISCSADKILANPGTITGSIGVVSGKFNIEDFLQEYGISVKTIGIGQNIGMASSTTPLTRNQLKKINTTADEIYQDFLRKVQTGRQLTRKQVLRIAKGRIWSGEMALQNGLVDELGGLNLAIIRAKEAAVQSAKDNGTAIDDIDMLKVVEFKESPLQKMLGIQQESSASTTSSDESAPFSIAIESLARNFCTEVAEFMTSMIHNKILSEQGITGRHMSIPTSDLNNNNNVR